MSKLVRFDWAIKYLIRNKANFDVLEGGIFIFIQVIEFVRSFFSFKYSA